LIRTLIKVSIVIVVLLIEEGDAYMDALHHIKSEESITKNKAKLQAYYS
jgi:hypothetical protein